MTATSDRRDDWDQDRLREAIAANPKLLDYVQVGIPASVLAKMPGELMGEVISSCDTSGSAPRVVLSAV